jgi:hypothetical protein
MVRPTGRTGCCVETNRGRAQKAAGGGLSGAVITHRTASSAASEPVFIRISGFRPNPIKYTDPDGMWTDNEDGTFTAEQGDTLWDLYGTDWQEKSSFNRDPKTLQVGETVGKKNPTNESIDTNIASSLISDTLTIPNTPANSSSDQQNSQGETRNILIGIGQMIGGGIVSAIGVAMGIVSEGSLIQPAYAITMSGVTLFAFGFGRTFGGHKKPITNDLQYMIPEPIGTYNEIYKHLK